MSHKKEDEVEKLLKLIDSTNGRGSGPSDLAPTETKEVRRGKSPYSKRKNKKR